jgi:hypothetical protein
MDESGTKLTDRLLQRLADLFFAEWAEASVDPKTEEVSDDRTEAFLENLRHWLDPSDAASIPRRCSIIRGLEGDPDAVGFTAEGAAFFCAWLRRNGVDPETGTSTSPQGDDLYRRCLDLIRSDPDTN